MWSYSTNVMGPAGTWWFEENNIPYQEVVVNNRFTGHQDEIRRIYDEYYGGRIDTYCDDPKDPDYCKYSPEVDLPIMPGEHFQRFDQWLNGFSSKRLMQFEELKAEYEKQTGELLELFCHD